MPLTSTEASAIEACIHDLLDDHIKMPFGVLRERGVVSDLRNRLSQVAFPSPVTPASIVQYPSRPGQLPSPSPYGRTGVNTDVYRVQQEIETALVGNSRSGSTKQLDIAVLCNSPTLHCAMNGPGDVVQWIHPTSIDVAIEVKASPSAAADMKGEYVKDIKALLGLARTKASDLHSAPACFFLVLDKSIELYGQQAHKDRIVWDSLHPQRIDFRTRKQPTNRHDSLLDAGVSIDRTAPSQPHVQIWTVGCDTAGGTWTPARYYAY